MVKPLAYPKAVFLLTVTSVTTAQRSPEIVDAGGFCTTTSDCNSRLLKCTSDGICLCNAAAGASLLYLFKSRSSVRQPKCEMMPCSLFDPEDKACAMAGADCVGYPAGGYGQGVCHCPERKVGMSWPLVSDSIYSTYCQDITISSVGQYCSSHSSVCDLRKKLRCHNFSCGCHDGYVFNYELDTCMKRTEYIAMFGPSNLGTYRHYCNTYADCNGGMSCINKRCNCPHFCFGYGDYVKTEDLCSCAFDPSLLWIIIPSFVLPIAAFVVAALFGIYFLWKKFHIKQDDSPSHGADQSQQMQALLSQPRLHHHQQQQQLQPQLSVVHLQQQQLSYQIQQPHVRQEIHQQQASVIQYHQQVYPAHQQQYQQFNLQQPEPVKQYLQSGCISDPAGQSRPYLEDTVASNESSLIRAQRERARSPEAEYTIKC